MDILRLGPQPHPYRRIRAHADGAVLAVKDWRLDFTVEDRIIRVQSVSTGYRKSQLAVAVGSLKAAPALHREFVAATGPATRTGMPAR